MSIIIYEHSQIIFQDLRTQKYRLFLLFANPRINEQSVSLYSDLQASGGCFINHILRPSAGSIPIGYQRIRILSHFPIPERASFQTTPLPLSRKPPDPIASLSGISLSQRIRARRSTAYNLNLFWYLGENIIRILSQQFIVRKISTTSYYHSKHQINTL